MLKDGDVTEDGYIVVGRFDAVSGTAEGEIDEALGEIDALRLHVLSTSQTWVILNEVNDLETDRTNSFVCISIYMRIKVQLIRFTKRVPQVYVFGQLLSTAYHIVLLAIRCQT